LSIAPRPPAFSPSTALLQSVEGGDGDASSSTYEKLDTEALIKYPLGLAAQTALMFGFLTGIDKMLAYFSPPLMKPLPFVVNFVFLYAFNLKSSFFSILPNKKSDGRKLNQENWEYNKRNIPSWTPPGIAFVFGWPLFTFGLRAFTGAMIVQSTGGRFASPAIMSLMLHFCMGNLWNTAYVFTNVCVCVCVCVRVRAHWLCCCCCCCWQSYYELPEAILTLTPFTFPPNKITSLIPSTLLHTTTLTATM